MENTHRRARRLTTITAIALVALTAAACSSNNNSKDNTKSGPKGTPFVASFFSNPLTGPDDQVGIDAAVKAINAAGGVEGHPIKVTSCTDNNDVNAATACARKAIDDASVLAFVAVGSSYGEAYQPLMQKANIANMGLLLSNAADNTSKVSFPFYGGVFNTIESAAAAVKLLGAKKLGVPYIGVPAGAQLAPFTKQVVGPMGASVVGDFPIPLTATDYSSFAAKEIAAKPDVVIDGQTADMYTKFIKAVRQQGDKSMRFLISTGVFDAQQVQERFGDDTNIYFVNEYDHASAGYKAFQADMDKYGAKDAVRNDSAAGGWLSVQAFARTLKALIAEGKTSPTRADIVDNLNKQAAFNIDGLLGPKGIDYTKPNTALGGAVPRLFPGAGNIWIEQYQPGGTSKPVGSDTGLFNLFDPTAK